MNKEYLKPTEFIDSDNPEVQAFAQKAVAGAKIPREKAIKLFYAVRDGIYYDPYRIDFNRNGFKASTILRLGYGFCVTKAITLAAVSRAQGIPARLHFANVRNHLTTERLKKIRGHHTSFSSINKKRTGITLKTRGQKIRGHHYSLHFPSRLIPHIKEMED